ncbi:MAG: CAP domain-containing protein [Pseudomonadota bacterium]|jgi:hypothetical protein
MSDQSYQLQLRQMIDTWAKRLNADREAQKKRDRELSQVERELINLLLKKPCSSFRLQSSIRKEWNFESVCGIAELCRAHSSTGAWPVLPPLKKPISHNAIRTILLDQIELQGFKNLEWVFLAGWNRYSARVKEDLLRVSSEIGASACVAWEEQYLGHSTHALRVFEDMNAHRYKHNLSPLVLRADLTRCALLHAMEIARTAKMSHFGADGSSLLNRLTELAIPERSAGENLYFSARIDADVVSAWMSSDSHRPNILGHFTHVGVATAAAEREVCAGGIFNCACVAVFA